MTSTVYQKGMKRSGGLVVWLQSSCKRLQPKSSPHHHHHHHHTDAHRMMIYLMWRDIFHSDDWHKLVVIGYTAVSKKTNQTNPREIIMDPTKLLIFTVCRVGGVGEERALIMMVVTRVEGGSGGGGGRCYRTNHNILLPLLRSHTTPTSSYYHIILPSLRCSGTILSYYQLLPLPLLLHVQASIHLNPPPLLPSCNHITNWTLPKIGKYIFPKWQN